MNNKQAVKKILLSRWQSLRLYNIVILAAFLLFYSVGSLQSYSFFAPPAAFNLPFIFPFSAILLCAYLVHCLLTKKEKTIFLLLPVLTLFSTLFITINSHFEAQTSQNSFLYFTLLLPLFYAYLLAYSFQLLLLNNIAIVICYTFTAVVGNTSPLVFILNAIFLSTLVFLTLFAHIKNNARPLVKKTENAANNAALNKKSAQYLQQIIHDIRQPLSSLSLYSHLLEKQLKQTAQHSIVQNLQKSSEQLDCWLSALFDLASLDSKSIQPQVENIHLLPVISPLIKKYQYQAKQQGLTLRVRITDVIINSDGKLINDILDTLLSNALIHGRQSVNSSILLSARKLKGAVNLQVWDQGEKIDSEQMNSLFDETAHCKNPLHNKSKWLGLGLSIAQRKAHLLETEIKVKTSDRGSCFSIKVKEGDKILASMPQNSISKGNNENILLVDDDLSILNALSLLFENWGYQLYCAETYAQALTILKQERFSLIISDFRLPGDKNGIDLIEVAQKEQQLAAVLLTGEVDPDKLKKGNALNYKILHKPIRPAVLRLLLRQLLS